MAEYNKIIKLSKSIKISHASLYFPFIKCTLLSKNCLFKICICARVAFIHYEFYQIVLLLLNYIINFSDAF